MMVLSDTYYPGWKATIDGEEVEIHEAYGALRGVVVPAGSHEVRFSYHPTLVYIGAFLTLSGILALGALQYSGKTR